jgi:hypothetical protein
LNDIDTADAAAEKLKAKHAKSSLQEITFDFPNRLWESIVLALELKPKPSGPIYRNCSNLSNQLTTNASSSQRKKYF